MHMVWPFGRVARRLGVPPGSRIGLQIGRMESASPELRVPWNAAMNAIAEIVELTGCSELGMVAARATQPLDLGPLARVVLPQPTLGHALRIHDHFYRLLTDGLSWQQEDAGDLVLRHLRSHDGSMIVPAVQEFSFAVWTTLARFLSGRKDIGPSEIRFTHAAPRDLTAYAIFRCPVTFGASDATFAIAKPLLSLPSIFADEVEAKAFELRLQATLDALPQPTTRELVVEALASWLSLGTPKPDATARRLGLTPRQLERRLKREGTSHRELLDETRHRLATEYLQRGELSTAEIAERLGFASVHSFHRAHRRIAGTSPGAIRPTRAKAKLPDRSA
jgi:AraC-like DNA-binding protein